MICVAFFTAVEPSRLIAESESEYLIKNWSVDEGLPSTSVYAIKQTSDGYLWLKTKIGIVRFDGVRFVEVFPELQNPNIVHGSADGIVWVTEESGELYHLDHGRLERVKFGPEVRRGSYGLCVDGDGISWISQGDSLRAWKDGDWLTDAQMTALGKKPPPAKFYLLNHLPNGGWMGHGGTKLGILRDGKFTPVPDNPARAGGEFYAPGLRRAAAWLLERPRTGGYSLRSISYAGESSDPAQLPWQGGMIGSYVEEDAVGNVWVTCATHGLARYGVDGKWELFNPTAEGNRRGLTTVMARCILHDQEGNIWVGTDGAGIFRFSRRTFRTYGSADGLETENVYSVAASKTGAVWMGTHSAASKALFKWEDGLVTFQPGMGFYGWSVYEDRSGVLWVGDYENGMRSLRDGVVAVWRKAPGGVYAICEDARGAIWAGGRGLCRVDSTGCQPMSWMPVKKTISALACEPDGTLWIGTLTDGLYRRHGDQLTQFTSAEGLPHNEVLSIYLDKGNSLWIGTRKGISRWKDDKFVNITLENGLNPAAVSGMAEDNFGNFWINSPTGIARILRSDLDQFFAGSSKRVFVIGYGRDDGLVTGASTTGTQGRVCVDKAGRVWFATLKGAAVADPAIMPLNTNPPPVVIEEVWSKGNPHSQLMVSSLSRTNSAREFPPGIQGFTIRYTANSFAGPDNVRFRYRLAGLSPEWVEAGTRREAVYDRLAHGNYQFEVTACNNHGLWNDHGAILAFTVLPFFWETRWFQVAAGAAILAAVGTAVRQVSTRQLRRRLIVVEREAAVERERARISRDMHDDLGARLTKISLLGELANRSVGRPAEAQEHLEKLSGLVTETSESLGELIWTIKPANDSVRSLVGHLYQLTDEYLRETQIRCRFDLPENLPATRISSDLRREVVLSMKEALNNVVKHSNATEVRLSVQANSGEMEVAISDNGKGLPSEIFPRATGGNGLVNLRQRLGRFGGSCEINNQAEGGVRVVLKVPV